MQIKVSYSKIQFAKTVNYISRNNSFFKGKRNYIKESLLDAINRLASDPNITYLSTMGFTLLACDQVLEGLDSDENSVRIEISVDPSLSCDTYTEDDWIEEVINTTGD